MTIRVGIMGYGNLGRGVECALKQNPDMELTAVFTRRDPGSVKILTEGVNVYPAKDAKDQKKLPVFFHFSNVAFPCQCVSLRINKKATAAVINSETVTTSQMPLTPKMTGRTITSAVFKTTPLRSVMVRESLGCTTDWK